MDPFGGSLSKDEEIRRTQTIEEHSIGRSSTLRRTFR